MASTGYAYANIHICNAHCKIYSVRSFFAVNSGQNNPSSYLVFWFAVEAGICINAILGDGHRVRFHG